MKTLDIQRLKIWFNREKRDLPWRINTTPYAIWVSEVMLQQTQVSVVIPYFERWMQRFPTIEALSQASLDEVIKLWEGLGYYSRARSLHAGAQFVMSHFNGALPESESELSKIKGLGPYTVGAIRSFAFKKKAAAVDGNVLRVLARYFHLDDDIAKAKTVEKFRAIAYQLLPEEESWIVNEALIELGATLCTRNPTCTACPLKTSCLAFKKGSVQQLPVKSLKIKYEKLTRDLFIVIYSNSCLIRRGKTGEIMRDLHEFPYVETGQPLDEQLAKLGIFNSKQLAALPEVEHSFTRFRVRLMPQLVKVDEPQEISCYQWIPIEKLHLLAFSSGHKRVLQHFLEWNGRQ